jgi:hypothetical protein
MAREELKLKMPGKLKKYLIQDWEAITKNEQVISSETLHSFFSYT